MVRAWYMDDEETDQRLEHHKVPPEFVDMKDVFSRTGVEYYKVTFKVIQAYINNINLFKNYLICRLIM